MRTSTIKTKAIKQSMDILPNYQIIGFYEKAIPNYIVTLKCEITSSDKFPVIHDTLIRLLHQEMDLDQIVKFLGLSESADIIEQVRLDLITAELIKYKNNQLTDLGRSYIRNNEIVSNKQIYYKIEIDGVTGEYKKYSKNLLDSKSLSENNISDIHKQEKNPLIHTIDKNKIRSIFNDNRSTEHIEQKQKFLDALFISQTNIEYRRVNCILLKNDTDDIKVLTFDRNTHLTKYDSILDEEIKGEYTLADLNIDTYLSSSSKKIKNYLKLDLGSFVKGIYVKDFYQKLIIDSKKSIKLIVPIMSISILKNADIEILLEKAKKGVKVEILFAGEIDVTDRFQQNQIVRISNVKAKNLRIEHIPDYIENVVFVDGYEGILIDYMKVDILNSYDYYSINEIGATLNRQQFEIIEKNISMLKEEDLKLERLYKDKKLLRIDMKKIVDELYILDSELRKRYGSVWRSTEYEEFSEVENVLNCPLVKNENTFKAFLSSLNKMLFESLPNKNLLFKSIKSDYPKLFLVIDKIRVYRNSVEHRQLKPKQADLYKNYIKEDLSGRSPFLVDDGFLILQSNIMSDLKKALEIE